MRSSAPFLRVLGQQQRRLGRILCLSSTATSSSSLSESNDELVISTVDEDAGIAMLTMNRPPANSLSLEMNEAICGAIGGIESNPKIQSVVLASSNRAIFSAGLDVSELVRPDEGRLPRFWKSLQDVYVDLYGSRLATVAAIGGHAPAAGCFLAMACDYRVMSAGQDGGDGASGGGGVPAIGMNETRLGIAAPPWMGRLLARTIGHRRAELALAMGTLFPPDAALEAGLVDEVAAPRSPGDVPDGGALPGLLPSAMADRALDPALRGAYRQARAFAGIPPRARVASKMLTREGEIREMISAREEDTDHFCEFVTQDAVQRNLMAYVEALKKGKKK